MADDSAQLDGWCPPLAERDFQHPNPARPNSISNAVDGSGIAWVRLTFTLSSSSPVSVTWKMSPWTSGGVEKVTVNGPLFMTVPLPVPDVKNPRSEATLKMMPSASFPWLSVEIVVSIAPWLPCALPAQSKLTTYRPETGANSW